MGRVLKSTPAKPTLQLLSMAPECVCSIVGYSLHASRHCLSSVLTSLAVTLIDLRSVGIIVISCGTIHRYVTVIQMAPVFWFL